MHLITTENPVPMGGGMALQPGCYLMDDMDAAQVIVAGGGGVAKLESFLTQSKLSAEYGVSDTITVIRPGRYGDLLLLTPVLREIKRRFPQVTLQISCLARYREVFGGLPYIDNFVQYPLPMDGTNYGCILSLEVLASLTQREGELHMTDLFAERLGIDSMEVKKPDFILTIDERTWAHDVYPRSIAKRVGIQVKSTTPSRDYPVIPMGEVVRRLFGRGWDVMMLGLPNQVSGKSKDRITNCAADSLTFRQSAAVLATCDVFLGPDSALIHVAGALEVPAVGLFSVVPWKLRTAYCPTTFVMQAKSGCDITPCFHAPRNSMGFPANGPCNQARHCCALATLDPHDVVCKVEQSVSGR